MAGARMEVRVAPDGTGAPVELALGATLGEAVDALDQDRFFRQALGPEIVDYLLMLKRFEYHRYQTESTPDPIEVTQWEQDEYFDFF